MPNVSPWKLPIIEWEGKKVIDSRAVHYMLHVGRFYPSWVREFIRLNKFKEGIDYYLDAHENFHGGRPSKDFYFVPRVAIELIMQTRVGDLEARRQLINHYFVISGEPDFSTF